MLLELTLIIVLCISTFWGYTVYLAYQHNPDNRALHVPLAALFAHVYFTYVAVRDGLDSLKP